MPQDPPSKTPAPRSFGHRNPGAGTGSPLQSPSGDASTGMFLTKRSAAVTLVLAGSAVFFAYNVRFQQSCNAPPPGAAPELLAEYERCRSRRTSSSSSRSHFWSSGGSSSSNASQNTATRGGFGGTGAGHASGG